MLSYYVFLRSEFRIKTMFDSSLPQLFVGGLMSYLCYMCLVRFILDQYAELDFYSARSLKQQSKGRHITPLRNIILIPSQSAFVQQIQYWKWWVQDSSRRVERICGVILLVRVLASTVIDRGFESQSGQKRWTESNAKGCLYCWGSNQRSDREYVWNVGQVHIDFVTVINNLLR
jgi:hypothetical protein